MKKGNQFYLELELTDKNNEKIDIEAVKKVQFNIDALTKTYDGENQEVTYKDGVFRVWLTEEETFKFKNKVKIEARVLFKNDLISGSIIQEEYFYDSLKEVALDVETENIE